jgi:hypothetical protein
VQCGHELGARGPAQARHTSADNQPVIAYGLGVTGAATLARRWIEAYGDYRDDDLIKLAHPEIVLRPRRGQGARDYHGLDGVRSWLADVGTSRPVLNLVAVAALEDGQVIAETLIDGIDVIALFDIRDDKIFGVSVYLSDRDMVQRLGMI